MTKKTRLADDQERNAFDDGALDISTLRRVEVSRGQPMSSLAVRFDAADLERLRQRAKAEGVGVTQLVRRWVRDRLDEPGQGDEVDDLLDALDRSVRAARALKRSQRQGIG
jgi:integrase